MARIRSVHPSLFTDEGWVSCSPLARILYIALWTDADDQGVFEWKPLQIKMRLLPGDMAEVGPLLAELVGVDLIGAFEAAGRAFGAIKGFRKFQRPQKPNAIHPLPYPWCGYVGLPSSGNEPVDDQSATNPVIPPQMEDGGDKIVGEEAADTSGANDVDDWPEGKSLDHARMLCDAVNNSGTLDTAREPGLIQSLGFLHRWRTRGASWEADVLPVVMAVAGRKSGTIIRNWNYFDDAVAKATEARLAPLKEGTTHGNENRPGRSGREADIDAMLEGARQAVDRRHAELSGCG